MGTGVYVEGSVGGETVEEPEGAVANGERVGEEAGVEGWGGESIDVEGRDGVRERGFLAWGCREGGGFGSLLLGLDVVDYVDYVAWAGGAGYDCCYACRSCKTCCDYFGGHTACA